MMQWALMPISFNRVGVNEGFILFWFGAGITELVCWAARNLNTKNTKKKSKALTLGNRIAV